MPADTLTKEQWKPVTDFPAFEVSNAWRFRKASNGKILPTKGHGGTAMVELTDRKGRKHAKNVRRTGESHWGYQHDVVLDNTTKPRERTAVRELANPISHQPPAVGDEEFITMAVEALQEAFEDETNNGERAIDVDAGQDLQTRYEEVDWPGTRKDWYEVSELGEVLTRNGEVLSPLNRGGNVRVSLLRSDRQGSAQVRLDLLVCSAFHGPRPGDDYFPRHIDNDRRNCRADNLRWEKVYTEESEIKIVNPQEYIEQTPQRREVSVLVDEFIKTEQQRGADWINDTAAADPISINWRPIGVGSFVPAEPLEAESITPDVPTEVQITTSTKYHHGLVTASVDGSTVTIDIEGCVTFDISSQDINSLIKVLSAIS